MSNPPSRLATGSHARFLLCLLALATVLRALVPVGYMPDAAALRQGRLQISFCSAAGGPPSVMTALMDARAPSPAMSDMSAMSDPRDGGHAGQADDAAQECPFWMVAHQTLDLPPLPYLPALPAAAVASVSRRRRCPCRRCSRPARRWGRAPRLSRPWPDRTIRARPRAFPAAVPPPAFRRLAPHSRSTTRARGVGTRAAVRHAKTETHRHAEPEFRISRALALATALAAIFPAARAQQAPAFDMDPVVITAVAPDSPLTFITNPKTPRQPLPASDGTDYLKTIPGFGHPQWRHQRRSGAARHVRFAPEHPDQRQRHARRLPGAHGRAQLLHFARDLRPAHRHQGTADRAVGPGASAGTVRFDRDTPRFTEAGVRFDGSLTGGSFGRNDQTADFTAGNESVYVRVTGNHSHSQDYKDGNGLRVPSRWDKWNTDLALGFTPDADTLFELTAGTGDGEARYAGRGMDGSKFKRELRAALREAQPRRHAGKDRGPALLQLRRPCDGQLHAAPARSERSHADGHGRRRGPRHLGRPRRRHACWPMRCP